MEITSKEMESLTSQIRSVLISHKGKTELRQLQRDYRMLMGEDIPYRKFGYPNLETFIRNIPTLNVTPGPGGSLLIEAVPSSKTNHIMQLINKQKTTKRKAGSGRLPPRHSSKQMTRSSYTPRQTRQTAANQQWRASFVNNARPKAHVHQIVVSVSDNTYPPDSSGVSSMQQRLVRNVSLAPTPLLSNVPYSENAGRKNPKLVRSVSSPLGGSTNQRQDRPRLADSELRRISNYLSLQREQRTTPPPPTSTITTSSITPTQSLGSRTTINNESRPRMRYVANLTTSASPPPHIAGFNSGPRCPAPALSNSEIDSLMKEAVAKYDSSGQVWQWSSSDDSSPRKSQSDSTPPKPQPSAKQDVFTRKETSVQQEISARQDFYVKQASPKEEIPIRRNSESNMSRPTYIPETDDLKKISELCRIHRLELNVKVLPRARKNLKAPQQYDCSIKIDNTSFSSYPRDCATIAEAEREAARHALEDLSARYSENKTNKKLYLATEHDVLTKIPPMIECHFHGVWAAQLAMDYEDEHGEQLPANWLALLDTLPTISVEPTLDNRYVLKVCKIGEKNVKPGIVPILNLISTDVSVPSNKIKLSEEGWTVEITFAASTVEIWCRIIGTDDANRFFDNNQKMQIYYNSHGGLERATNVSSGGFYVVQYESYWSRVRVLDTREHDVTCFFIDYGDEQVVSRSDMYDLKREFAKDQAQAFVCRLSGLEELANMKAAQSRLENISGKSYLAKPQMHEMQKTEGPEAISIILYDYETSEDSDEDINHLLMRQITYDSVPQLDPLQINRVYVTHATDKGELYVQPHCEAFTKINELVTALNDINFDNELPGQHIPQKGSPEATPEEDSKRLYLARWIQGDGNFYRSKIVDRSPCGQYAQLHFIDFGNTQIINLNNSGNVYPLEKISEVLMCFPALATRVKLDVDLKANGKTGEEPGFASKIMQLMPSEQLVLLKIIKSTEDEDGLPLPVCEMFCRSDSRNELFSVSASLRYGRSSDGETLAEDTNNNDKTTQLAKKLQRLRSFGSYDNKPVPSTGELASPELPGPGSFLDVRIPSAVNPWNFFIQPYSSAADLLDLMDNLQDRYGKYRKPEDRIQLEDVIPGKIYAAKHIDGIWYRTSVIKIINSGSISVFYCDMGYYANLTVEQLLPLDPEYLTLPYQAVKARLAGIKPRNAKWSMDDCRHFEKLVRHKNFVSVVVAVQQDELYKCDSVLVLRLIDTSTDVDVHVDKLLIEEGIAAQLDN